ncbi:hypothetical protein [Campylobacter showae]|uniref:hypothetical protein n=1 Tax=Campylobacter showae TaxID=204 RepID=UPI000F085AE1|nr:hypothetical protein [Campylobacter showae]
MTSLTRDKIVKFANFKGELSCKFMILFCKILLNFIFKNFGFSDFNASNLTKFTFRELGGLVILANKFD